MNNKFEQENRTGSRLMTQFTKDALEQRLSQLQEQHKRFQLEMGAAIEKGDEYHDNFAYEEASRQADLASRMLSEIKDKLYDVTIIEPRKQIDTIGVGNTITVRFAGETEDETFTLLGPDDASQNKQGWISYESPLGTMLLGKHAGDNVEYHIPKGQSQHISIKEVLPGSF